MSDSHYDSAPDTLIHIDNVRILLGRAAFNLMRRAETHDQSKLAEPEKSAFDKTTSKLKALTYGSNEYKAALAELEPALQHHYECNSHHPEHYQVYVCNVCFTEYAEQPNHCHKCGNSQFSKEGNIGGMSLLDLLEMLCDWKAATLRHANGALERSFTVNKERFHISPQLDSILRNTAKELCL